MQSNADLARGWMDSAGIPVPDNVADVLSAANDLSHVLAGQAVQLTMSDFDVHFGHTLLELAAPYAPVSAMSLPRALAPEACTRAVHDALDAIRKDSLGSLAWTQVDGELALQVAREKDCDHASMQRLGPLYGIVVGLKDMFDREGHTAQWGSVLRAEAVPAQQDATIVARLKSAGAIPLGTLHMAEFALSPTGLNSHFGSGRNPHDYERVSGGSSSGCGMAVGAGHVPLAIGSDTGGSIRLPAAFCGIFGLKPTQYRVSLAGVMPLSPSLDCVGPLATSVELCAAAFSAMAGPDDRDSLCLSVPAPDEGQWLENTGSSFSVAVPKLSADDPASFDVRQVLQNVVGRLRDAGVTCTEVDMPDLELLGKLGSIIMATESAALHRVELSRQSERYGNEVKQRISRGFLLGATDYLDALRLRSKMLRRFMNEIMGDADACLLPAAPCVAPLLNETAAKRGAELDRMIAGISHWVRGVNYLGVPALVVPAGTGAQQMPLGVQLIGAPLGEERLFALAKLLAT